MRILLQHIRTQLYLRSLGSWTPNPHDALDFQLSRRAIDFARDHTLTGVQIVVTSFGRRHDEVHPLPANGRMPARHAKS